MSASRYVAVMGVGLLLGGVGCAASPELVGTSVDRAWESPAPAQATAPVRGDASPAMPTTSAPSVAAPEVLAVVNGAVITRAEFDELLLDAHGLNILEQLVLLAAARRRADELGLAVGPQDVAAAHEDALARLAEPADAAAGEPIDRAAARQLLDRFLLAKNISRREWDLRMRQRAYLAKIAQAEVAPLPVTEKALREEYELAYGEKVQIRHIQLPSLAAVTRAKALLAEKKDFELIARQLSENDYTASRGGLLPPFPRHDPAVPPLIRETAFTMQVGEVSSAVHEQNTYHLIRLERRFPASDVPFEKVDKAELRRRLLDRLARQRQEALEAELFQSAAVDIRDPHLRRLFLDKHRSRSR